jgi:hypothetical protein
MFRGPTQTDDWMLLNCHSVVQESTNVQQCFAAYGPKILSLSELKGKATPDTFSLIKNFLTTKLKEPEIL